MQRLFTASRPLQALAPAALAAGLFLVGGHAHAALSENIGVDPAAMSMGNAVTADPPGVAAVHFNPAGLTRLKGDVRSDAVFGASIKPYASFHKPDGFDIGGWTDDPIAGTSTGRVRQTLFIPAIGIPKARLPAAAAAGLGLSFHKEGSPWTFATASYVTQAMGVDRTLDKDDPARFDGKKVVLQRLVYLAPSVAYKFSDTLSFGVAVPIAHQGFGLDTDMRMPNELLGIIGTLQDGWCGDDSNPLDEFGFGLCGDRKGGGRLRPFNKIGSMQFEMTAPAEPTLNLGVLWEPKPWLSVGATFQTGSKSVLTGRYTFNAEPDLDKFVRGMYNSLLGPLVASMFGMPTSIPAVQSGNVTMVLPFPEHLQLGVSLRPISRLKLNVDAGWTNWKRWDKFTLQFDRPINLLMMARVFGQADASKLVLPRHFKNTIDFSLGMEARLTDKIVVRAGYEPRKSSIPRNQMDLVAPLPDLTIKSIGAAYELKEGTRIELAASYASARFDLPAETSCNLNCSNFFNVIYNPYAGLDVNGGIRIRYVGLKLTHPF